MPGDSGPSPFVAGFDIGGTNVRGLMIDAAGRVAGSGQHVRPSDPDGIVDSVATLVDQLQQAVDTPVEAVGVGCAGTVDRDGVVHASPNIPSLVEYPLGEALSSRLGCRVVVDNDATTATWAEVHSGAAQGFADVAFVALGTGIGMGLVLGHELQRGSNGFAGEAGHMVVQAAGPECVCGRNGCWEMFASGRALGRLAREAAVEGRVPAIVDLAGGVDSIEGEHVSQLVAEGNPQALSVLDELGWWVGLGITNLVNVLDVSAVVIGGGLSEIGEPLVTAIRRGYNTLQHDIEHRPDLEIIRAVHGAVAGALGAALLAQTRH